MENTMHGLGFRVSSPIRGTFLGVPTIKITAFWCLYRDSLVLGNCHIGMYTRYIRKIDQLGLRVPIRGFGIRVQGSGFSVQGLG